MTRFCQLTGCVAKICRQEIFQEDRGANDKRKLETTMQSNSEPKETADYAFQVDLLNLNLHLAETEKFPESQTQAIEAALAQLKTSARSV